MLWYTTLPPLLPAIPWSSQFPHKSRALSLLSGFMEKNAWYPFCGTPSVVPLRWYPLHTPPIEQRPYIWAYTIVKCVWYLYSFAPRKYFWICFYCNSQRNMVHARPPSFCFFLWKLEKIIDICDMIPRFGLVDGTLPLLPRRRRGAAYQRRNHSKYKTNPP